MVPLLSFAIIFVKSLLFLLGVISLFAPLGVNAQDTLPAEEYIRAQVLSIQEKQVADDQVPFQGLIDKVDGDIARLEGTSVSTHPVQVIKVRLEESSRKGDEIEITQGGSIPISENQRVKVGEEIVVVKVGPADAQRYYVVDHYRIPSLGIILAIFFAIIIFFGRIKGFTSLLGLGFSILILSQFIVPGLLSGHNPLLVTFLGSLAIAVVSLYLAHGISRRTSVALGSTIITLGIAIGCSVLFVTLSQLFGTGSEDALFLQSTGLAGLNLRGLLLSGIIIGTLGVLDDITTAQAAVIDELHKANPRLSPTELYRRGLSVGREHIASLVNTLVLAYAGASLPLFLLFRLNNQLPFWVTLNSEAIAEELVRTLIGSSALILAVPITTALAVAFLPKRPASDMVEG